MHVELLGIKQGTLEVAVGGDGVVVDGNIGFLNDLKYFAVRVEVVDLANDL